MLTDSYCADEFSDIVGGFVRLERMPWNCITGTVVGVVFAE